MGTGSAGCSRSPEAVWRERFALRTRGVVRSAIREFLKLSERPEVISFAGGLPAAELFPLAQVSAATQRVLGEHGAAALQYGSTEGYAPLRELLARHMGRYGIGVTAEEVLITSGSQQALDLIGKLLLDPGDRVVTETPTYLGAIQAFSSYQASFLGVPVDDAGLQIEHLETVLRARPKFCYVLPNFQNPSGVTLSLDRRRRLLDLADGYDVPIVEDDPYGQLRYEGDHLPALASLAGDRRGLYLGTFSKVLAPGLRLGWVAGPRSVIARLVELKQGADLHTSTFTQMVAYHVARGGFLDDHVQRIRDAYRQRRDAMLAAMERQFPPGVRWTRPQGGLFLWVTLPAGIDSAGVLHDALAEGVAFVPGGSFFPGGGGDATMRLNFSYCNTGRIEEGITRLATVLRRRVVNPSRGRSARGMFTEA